MQPFCFIVCTDPVPGDWRKLVFIYYTRQDRFLNWHENCCACTRVRDAVTVRFIILTQNEGMNFVIWGSS